MIYEVKASAANNAGVLFHQTNGKEYFYWNQKVFKSLAIGDPVFVVNRPGGYVLQTTVDAFDIPALANDQTTIVNDKTTGASFTLNEPYGDFVRLRVDQKLLIPNEWSWKSLGSSETTYLYGSRINKDKVDNRLDNIRSLRQLTDDIEFTKLLTMSESAFNGESQQYDPKKQEVAELLKEEKYQDIINSEDFYFQKAVDILNEFKTFTMPVDFYEGIESQLTKQFNFNEFVEKFEINSDERRLLLIIGKLLTYIDLRAANKNQLNEYADKRTIAGAGVRMNHWIGNLLRYKINNGYDTNIRWSVSNALTYLEDPNNGSTALSDEQRKLINNKLFNKPYDPFKSGSFAADLKEYFSDCLINPKNPQNYTLILSKLLYESYFKNQWQPDDEVGESGVGYALDNTPTNVNISSWLRAIHQYITSKGFTYSLPDLANFYLSLRTKPFVILAGISGTGKTQLPRLFAEAIGAHVTLVPVRPDWTDNSDLIGYTNLNQQFEKKAFLTAILEARQKPQQPYFIVLDEMNLARVEHYFSDFLSILETRQKDGTTIKTNTILTEGDVGLKTTDRNELVGLTLPPNVFIIGTVNMDETTHPFSKKVLDRANAIEINDVDLDFPINDVDLQPLSTQGGSFLEATYVIAKDLSDEERDNLTTSVLPVLKFINQLLQEADLQFGYRVRDVISFYMTYAQEISDIITFEQALDYQIIQKILPRIQGSSVRVQELIISFGNLLLNKTALHSTNTYDQNLKLIQEALPTCKYPKSLRKINFMLKRYQQDGFTSFWL
jgi:hypothetical protein